LIRRALAGCLALLGAIVAPINASADATDEAPEAPRPFSDRIGLNFAMGYGHGYSMRERTTGKDVADVRLLLIQPHLRIELGDWSPKRRWYAGVLDLIIEPQLAINFVPETGVGGGITGGFRYMILADRTWSPYTIGTAGFGGIDYDLVSQDDGFSFFLQFGFGVRRALANGQGLNAEVRMYHISNAATHLPNDGIDAIAFMLGYEFR